MSKSHPLNRLGAKGIRMTHLVLEDDCGLDAEFGQVRRSAPVLVRPDE